jgi:predicted negative regulator of RcsB-dependent stress response
MKAFVDKHPVAVLIISILAMCIFIGWTGYFP